VVTDPFRIDGPTIINVSGGRTSALMLRRYLDANGGRLPVDAHAVFANVGRERPETLDFLARCADAWGVDLRWVERAPGGSFREVTHATASRDGEPFAELVRGKRFLPNPTMRFCTIDLKIKTARDYMRAQGYDRWTSAVGLRFDEPARVHKLRDRDHGEWDVACPLFDAKVTKRHVTEFWKRQPFDLALEPWEGNCDLCFLKGRAVRERIMRDRPDLAAWWIAQEEAIGARFLPHEPTYAKTLDAVRRLPLLPLDLDAEVMACTSGGCTDRRPSRACNCRKRRGEGHALSCARVLGERRVA
jgi:hypothetical protein